MDAKAKFVVFAALGGALMAAEGSGGLSFEVVLPVNWEAKSQIHLTLKNVETPRSRPAKFRALAGEGSSAVVLGTTAVVGDSADAKANRRLEMLRFNVGHGLRRWAAQAANQERIKIRVEPVDSSGREMKDYQWSAVEAVIETH